MVVVVFCDDGGMNLFKTVKKKMLEKFILLYGCRGWCWMWKKKTEKNEEN